MSSGLTDGEPCRKTTSSIAHGSARVGVRSATATDDDRGPGVEAAQPLLGHPLDHHLVRGEQGVDRGLASSARVSGERRAATSDASSRSASEPPALGHDLDHVQARRAAPRRGPAWTRAGSTTSASAISRYSASLADPVGEAPA